MPWTEIHHATFDALLDALAAQLSSTIETAMRERGSARLAIAGGRTAPPLLHRLATGVHDWRGVTVVPTDERWVNAEHPDNNLGQLRAAFGAPPGPEWIALVPDEPLGEADATHANAALARLGGDFDATLLGMGADGHFASLFAGADTLAAALDPQCPVAAMALHPDPMPAAGPHPRISMTLARLLQSRHVMLAVSGDEKRDVLERAQRDNDPARLPVAALLHAASASVQIHWSP